MEGILEFLKSIGKLENAVIAESAANGPTLDGFANYGYDKLAAKYGVKLVDLDQEPNEMVHVFDEKDFRPHAVRMSRLLLDPHTFIISAARMKTHDRIVATLVAEEHRLRGADQGPGLPLRAKAQAGHEDRQADRPRQRLSRPQLQSLRPGPAPAPAPGRHRRLRGHGRQRPASGTPVDHRVCVVSPDWLAADRVAVELMGIDFAKVGYLNYCAEAGLGEADLKKIEILGESIAPHVKPYKLHDNIEKQLIWMKPAQVS